MQCPACGRRLTQKTVEGIAVDVCVGGCGGIWFDNYELEKMDEPHESAGEMLLDVERDEMVSIDQTARRLCPICDNITMMQHFFSVRRSVTLDECPSCGGIWLDSGELGLIRNQFTSERERRQAAEAYFNDVFGPKLGIMREEGEEQRQRARKIARIFRYICPSNYMPGKQEWGAY